MAVFLTDLKAHFAMPDGSTATIEAKAGDAVCTPGGHHLPENLTDQPFELLQVVLESGKNRGGDD